MPKGIKGFQKGHKVFGGLNTRFNQETAKIFGFQKGHGRLVKEYKEGENSPNWKGNNVLYYSKHCFVKRAKGKPNYCEFCKTTKIPKGKKQFFEWANIDHKYSRKLEDYIRLCRPCHIKYDKSLRLKNNMPQQQSNHVMPQKVGGKKKSAGKKKKGMPSFNKVEKSVKKTMGY